CKPSARDRPFGYYRLGKVAEFKAGETFFPDYALAVRSDHGGLYAMSLMCPYDLSKLESKETESGTVYFSTSSGGVYDHMGKKLSGPSAADLPFYELSLRAGEYGGTRDTIFVKVGKQVSPGWRLKLGG
ncbi:MAG: hypothetical protein DCC75_14280, partial [Proteobacteria bacterium]